MWGFRLKLKLKLKSCLFIIMLGIWISPGDDRWDETTDHHPLGPLVCCLESLRESNNRDSGTVEIRHNCHVINKNIQQKQCSGIVQCKS